MLPSEPSSLATLPTRSRENTSSSLEPSGTPTFPLSVAITLHPDMSFWPCRFFLGSAMQTGAHNYETLVVGRTFGGSFPAVLLGR